ncbi:hypothetical protein BH23PLA1_BH23PLA1_34170 [soil metagenome]
MGLFDSLRKLPDADQDTRSKLLKAWGLEEESPLKHSPLAGNRNVSAYDLAQWHKKLTRILAGLPDTEHEWPIMMSEAKALGFDKVWVMQVQVAEFQMLVRRAVADRILNEKERLKLDRARFLIGLTEAEAKEIYDTIIAEAESFFGGDVKKK